MQKQMPMRVAVAERLAIEARLAAAKHQHDARQADLRQARSAATAATKELALALQGWYAIHPQEEAE